jgi:hypothetical protein
LLDGAARRDARALVVAFETLVTEPAAILERVWQFLGLPVLPFDEVLEQAEVRPLAGSGFTVNTVRDGIRSDLSKTESWRRHLRPAQQAYIEAVCKDLMARLGYVPDVNAISNSAHLQQDQIEALRDIGILWEYLRHWPAYLLHTMLRRATLRLACMLRGSHGGRRR